MECNCSTVLSFSVTSLYISSNSVLISMSKLSCFLFQSSISSLRKEISPLTTDIVCPSKIWNLSDWLFRASLFLPFGVFVYSPWHLQLVCEEIDGSFSWLLGHVTTKKFLVSLKFPVDKLSSRGWPLVLYVFYSLAERRRRILLTFEKTI